MDKLITFYKTLMVFIFMDCSPKSGQYSSAEYQEDLSNFRDEVRVNLTESVNANPDLDRIEYVGDTEKALPENDITSQINALLDSMTVRNQEIRYVQGYTIQVYNGTSREEAHWSEKRIYQIYDDADPVIKYVQPNFKVKIGQYTDRLEAQQVYMKLKKDFPNAIIIPDKIAIPE